jgi:hypothetical protein
MSEKSTENNLWKNSELRYGRKCTFLCESFNPPYIMTGPSQEKDKNGGYWHPRAINTWSFLPAIITGTPSILS